MREIIINSPLYIIKSGKKRHLNLNNYRNWHYQLSNNLKIAYLKIIAPQLLNTWLDTIKIDFTFYKPTKRKYDRSNVLSIHEKFFCDAMVKLGCIKDDNDDFIESTHYYDGGIDRENPRVEIKITEL